MRAVLGPGLWCCAAWLWTCATAAEPIAGPWIVLTPDGGARIGCEWDAAPPGFATLAIDGVPTLTTPAQRRLERMPGQRTTVVDVALERAAYRPGGFVLTVGGRRLEGRLPRLPAANAAVRVAIVGGANYPDAERLHALGEAMGGAPEVVVAAGPGLIRRLGTGGWEATTPLLLVGSGQEDLDGFAPVATWPRGRTWGALGLACAESDDAWSPAVAGMLCPWRVMLDPRPQWDPGVLAPAARAEPEAIADLIALAGGLQVPVILACGGRAGFVSEPLVVRDRVVRVSGPGPRVIGATPAGEALALGETIAAAIHAPGLVGLHADIHHLRLIVIAAEEPTLALGWSASSGEGWGAAPADTAWKAWRAGDASTLASVAWAAGSELAAVTLSDEDRIALLAAAADDGAARIAARRLLSLPGAPAGPIADHPPWLAREIALRDLARGLLAAGAPATVSIVTGSDERVLAAALRAARGPYRARLLSLFIDRLQAQIAGTLPFAADPLLQHRLVAAVFDATDLGPTPLRPLAVALRGSLDPLTRGPVDRFLAQYGEVRPPTK